MSAVLKFYIRRTTRAAALVRRIEAPHCTDDKRSSTCPPHQSTTLHGRQAVQDLSAVLKFHIRRTTRAPGLVRRIEAPHCTDDKRSSTCPPHQSTTLHGRQAVQDLSAVLKFHIRRTTRAPGLVRRIKAPHFTDDKRSRPCAPY